MGVILLGKFYNDLERQAIKETILINQNQASIIQAELPARTLLIIENIALNHGLDREEVLRAFKVCETAFICIDDFAAVIAGCCMPADRVVDLAENLKTLDLPRQFDQMQDSAKPYEKFLSKPIGKQRRSKFRK